jgi:hypothetical protein
MNNYKNDTGNITTRPGRPCEESPSGSIVGSSNKGRKGRDCVHPRLRKNARRDGAVDAGRPRHSLNVPGLKKETARLIATIGDCNRYVVDADGNVYSRLKEQGVANNPRFHLWLDDVIVKVYKKELRKAAISASK